MLFCHGHWVDDEAVNISPLDAVAGTVELLSEEESLQAARVEIKNAAIDI